MKDRQQIDGYLTTQLDPDYRKNGYGKLPSASVMQDFLKPAANTSGSSAGQTSTSQSSSATSERKP